MGVILRQGFKHSTVTMAATLVGMVNMFIYTAVLTKDELGFFQYLLSIAILVSPFLLFGADSVTTKFFPVLREKALKNNGFLFFLLLIPSLSFSLFMVGCIVFKDQIFQNYQDHPNAKLLFDYLYLLPWLISTMLITNILTRYIANFKLIVVPEIINNLWLKVTIPLLAIIYYLGYISFGGFLIYLTVSYGLRAIFLILYLYKIGALDLKPNFKFFEKPLLKNIANFAGFSMLGGLGSMLATRIDTYMVGTLIDMSNVAVYGIATFVATVIGIPLKSVFSITSPIIADLMGHHQLVKIKELYKKTSLNLLVIGLLLLIGIWGSIDLLFEIMPNGEQYAEGKYVVLILGAAKIIDMVTSINTHIIVYSEYYRFNFYVTLILAVLNIVFNILFIPLYGIIGVALATFSSMFIYNLIKHIYVLLKFDMQPLTWNMLWVLLIGFVAYGTTLLLPTIDNPYIDIILNSAVITLIYVPCILYFDLSEDLAQVKYKLIDRFLKK